MHVDRILRRAWRAATDGDGTAALDALLEAWRTTRHPAIAELIDTVGGELVLSWIELGDLRHAVDPRMTRALFRLLEATLAEPVSDGAARAAWLLTLVGDVRALAPLRGLRSDAKRPWAAAAFEAAERHLAAVDPPPLTATSTAILDALAAGKPAPTVGDEGEATFIAAVHAAPHDDEPRLVYADWLSDRGDPRGELIVLQCERARTGAPPSSREEELLQRHGRAWLVAAEPYVARAGADFVRGFLDGVRLRAVPPVSLLDDPIWTTVTHLELPRGGLMLGVVVELLARDTQLPSLASLRARAFRAVEEVAAIAATAVGRRLRTIELGLFRFGADELPPLEGLAAWFATAAPPALERLALVGDASSVTFSRDAWPHARIGARERRRDALVDLVRRQLGARHTIDVDKPVPPR